MKLDLPFVPAIHSDEPVAAYLRRVSPHWARGGMAGHAARMLDNSIRVMNMTVPSMTPLLNLASQLTGHGLELIFQQHTLWPVARLLARRGRGVIKQHKSDCLEPSGYREAEANYVSLPKTTMLAPTWRFGICYKCVKADVGNHGAATWRRLHFFAGLRICPEHGSELYNYCKGCCVGRPSAFVKTVAPGFECICGGRLDSRMTSPATAVYHAEERVAWMLSALLRIGVRAERGARQILAQTYRREATKMGLSFRTYHPPLVEFYDMLCATLGPDFLESRGYGIQETKSLIKPFLPQIGRPDPITHAILASALFSNADYFYEEVVRELESKKDAS